MDNKDKPENSQVPAGPLNVPQADAAAAGLNDETRVIYSEERNYDDGR